MGQVLRNDNDYMLPHPRLEAFKKIPLYSLPLAWNNAGDIRFKNNRMTFKIALKDKLLNEINNTQQWITMLGRQAASNFFGKLIIA